MVAAMVHVINVLIIAGLELCQTVKNWNLRRLLTPGAQLVKSHPAWAAKSWIVLATLRVH